jgi:CRP-like cAMP-binding protein
VAEIPDAVPLFAGLSKQEREYLGSLLRVRQYSRDEVIFKEGDEGTGLGLIASGRVRMQLTGGNGRQVVINVYGPGEIFGELALLDGEPRSVDAIAQDAARVLWLQREDFAGLLDSHPHAAMTMLASLRRPRPTTRSVQNTALRDVPAQLARVLLDLAMRNGRAVEQGILIETQQTQSELAAMVSAPRELVVKALRGFERQGLIGRHSNRIMVNRPRELRALAEGA